MPPRLPLPSVIFSLAAGLLMALVAPLAQAEEKCGTPDAHGARSCRAGLAAGSVERMAVAQEQTHWCWAASISMIFAHYGYHVAQQEIVRDGYGIVADLPAPSGEAMTNALSRAWVDEDARPFRASALASDALARRYQVSNDEVVAELAADRPLLVGAVGHAVVLVGLDFKRLATGEVRITGGTVIDPQPGRGVRPMITAELRPTYVAAVRVVAAEPRAAREERVAAALAQPDASVLR